MPSEVPTSSIDSPQPTKKPWLRWVLIWLFGAAVGAAIVIWWLLPQVGKVSFNDVIQRHVKPSVTPTASVTPAPAGKTTVASDVSTPAAGTCLGASAKNVVVTLNPDIPSPRCVEITSGQTWSFNNQTGQAVTVVDHAATVAIPAGGTGTFDFTKYSFASGVHEVKVNTASGAFYGGSGPEVWVK